MKRGTLANALGMAVAAMLMGCQERADVQRGVVLGMAPSQVRERWAFACQGNFVGRAEDEDFVLDWHAGDSHTCVPAGAERNRPLARFEFHGGMLVAMRIATDEQSFARAENGAWIQVREQAHGSERSDLQQPRTVRWKLVIAESCPVHQREVAALRATQSLR